MTRDYGHISRVLQGCNSFRKFLQIHALIILNGFQSQPSITEKLLHFCAVSVSGSLRHARLIFRHLDPSHRTQQAWNIVIRGCSVRSPFHAVLVYNRMLVSGHRPDTHSFSFALKATARIYSSVKCHEIHCFVLRSGYSADVVVLTNLAQCYCGSAMVDNARLVFDEMPMRDVVAWNSMLSCYSRAGKHAQAIDLCDQMRNEGVSMDSFTLVALLSSCAHVGAINIGSELHRNARDKGIDVRNVFVGNALIDMYAKCGDLKRSICVFSRMKNRDLLTWNSIICGLGIHGFGRLSIYYFSRMLVNGVQPNSITFLGLLLGCSHEGLVKEGEEYFHQMHRYYNIKPGMKHYGCLVDLYGRAGKFQEALGTISSYPAPADPVLWRSLLGSCKIHTNVEIGEISLTNLIRLQALNAGDCVLLASIYSDGQDERGVAAMRKFIRRHAMRTTPGCSWIEVFNQVHRFVVNDKSHPETKMIYIKLEEVTSKLRLLGYSNDELASSLPVYAYEDGVEAVHSEKLAIVYGLAKTNESSTLRIVKNLRVCRDCHAFTKLVSKAFGRTIVVRDRVRFHHFVEGKCSCRDYW